MSNALYPTLAGLTWNTTKQADFNVIIQRAVNLAELRGSFTSTPIYTFVLTYDLLRDDSTFNELKQLLGFFLARSGSFDSFLYLDADDSVATAQSFGVPDGVTQQFQLARSLGAFTEACSNIGLSPQIFLDGVLQTTGYTVGATGIVAFAVAPVGLELTWTGTYYFRCRFSTDNTPVTFNQFMRRLWELKQVEFAASLGTKI